MNVLLLTRSDSDMSACDTDISDSAYIQLFLNVSVHILTNIVEGFNLKTVDLHPAHKFIWDFYKRRCEYLSKIITGPPTVVASHSVLTFTILKS